MANIVICALTNLFRIYLIRKFIKIFLKNAELGKIKELMSYGAFFFVNTGLYLVFHLTWVNFISNIVGISLLIFLYTNSLKTNLFVTGSIYLINMGCDSISVMLFVDYEIGKEFNQLYEIVTVFLLFICELLAEKIISYRNEADKVQNLPLILVPFNSIVVMWFLLFGRSDFDFRIVVTSMGLLVINFLVFYLYNMQLKSLSEKYENEMLQHQVDIYSNQVAIILQSEDRIKTLKHDMKHHLNELKILAMKNDVVSIQRYIDEMKEFIQMPDEIVASGNIEIDSVLNYMLEKAKRVLKVVKVKIQLPEYISHSFDINIILGNLLENAIEAAQKTEDKRLTVCIFLKKGVLKIEVVNSFDGVLIRDKTGFLTTKKEKEQHGIGMNSVRKIVEKYNGILDIHTEENLFYVELMLYMTKIDNCEYEF